MAVITRTRPADDDLPPLPGATAEFTAPAAVVLAFSLAISYGTLHPLALWLVTLATLIVLAAVWRAGSTGRPARRGLVLGTLGFGIVLGLAHDAAYLPGVLVDPARLGAFRPTLAAVSVVVASLLWRGAPRWLRRVRFALLLIGAGALGALVLAASPRPGIDVWHFQQEGALALLRGLDPYAMAYRNVYGPGTTVIDPRLLSPDRQLVLANPYPPLSLLLDVPAALLGDIRWTLLAGVLASAALIRRLGCASLEAELAATFLLVQPQAFFVLEMSWTEPAVLALLLAAVLAVVHASESPARSGGAETWQRRLLPGLAAGLAASGKQYAAALLLPLLLLLDGPARRRGVKIASAVVVAVALPFLAAEPTSFIRSVVAFQVFQPFRPDALSWPAQLEAMGWPRQPNWAAFVLAGGTYLLAWWRSPRPPSSVQDPAHLRALAAKALVAATAFWLVFVLFNKQAFCNYYWLAVGLLCAATALGSATHGGRPEGQREARTRPTRKVSSGPSPQAQGQ